MEAGQARRSLSDGITAEAIRAHRARTGQSMAECKRALMRENALAAIDQAQNVDDLKELLPKPSPGINPGGFDRHASPVSGD